MQHLLGAFPYVDQYVPLRWRVMAPTEKRPPHRSARDGADTQTKASSIIATAVPREKALGIITSFEHDRRPKRLFSPYPPPPWLTASRLEQASLNKASYPGRL